ncbi:MAG: LysM peptidoglycan-binding domain-containing protein [Actinomycetota bacterium]|nr:LysM peptidoglycan-binding domain-containing protein [Actinomycetota bacterium]
MTQAYIELSDWDTGAFIDRVEFPFNPEKFSVSTGGEWREPANTGAIQYLGPSPRQITIAVFLDERSKHSLGVDVVRDVDTLLSACYPTSASESAGKPKGPRAKFGWDRVHVDGYIKSVSVDYMMFDRQGIPVRAECQVSLTEVVAKLPGQNPTSGTIKVHRTVETTAGDTLARVAYKELGDPVYWRAIAELNGIDDPMRVRPGTRLLVPARGEVRGEG